MQVEEDMGCWWWWGGTRVVRLLLLLLLLLLGFLCALAHALGEVRDACVCEERQVEWEEQWCGCGCEPDQVEVMV